MLEWNSCMLCLSTIFSLIISLCNELIPKDHVIQCRLNALVAELVLQVIKKDDFGDWLIEKIQFLWKASLVCFGVQPIWFEQVFFIMMCFLIGVWALVILYILIKWSWKKACQIINAHHCCCLTSKCKHVLVILTMCSVLIGWNSWKSHNWLALLMLLGWNIICLFIYFARCLPRFKFLLWRTSCFASICVDLCYGLTFYISLPFLLRILHVYLDYRYFETVLSQLEKMQKKKKSEKTASKEAYFGFKLHEQVPFHILSALK